MEEHIDSILKRLKDLPAPYMWSVQEEERFYDLQLEAELVLNKKGVVERDDKL